MRRRLFNLAANFSFPLFLTTIIVWIASYLVSPARVVSTLATDPVGRVYTDNTVIAIHEGVFYTGRYQHGPDSEAGPPVLKYTTTRHFTLLPKDATFSHTFAGFSIGGWSESTGVTYALGWQFSFPFWLVALTLFALHRQTRPPPNPNLCSSCRYDLTGNVSGTCPECGTRISARAAAPGDSAALYILIAVFAWRAVAHFYQFIS